MKLYLLILSFVFVASFGQNAHAGLFKSRTLNRAVETVKETVHDTVKNVGDGVGRETHNFCKNVGEGTENFVRTCRDDAGDAVHDTCKSLGQGTEKFVRNCRDEARRDLKPLGEVIHKVCRESGKVGHDIVYIAGKGVESAVRDLKTPQGAIRFAVIVGMTFVPGVGPLALIAINTGTGTLLSFTQPGQHHTLESLGKTIVVNTATSTAGVLIPSGGGCLAKTIASTVASSATSSFTNSVASQYVYNNGKVNFGDALKAAGQSAVVGAVGGLIDHQFAEAPLKTTGQFCHNLGHNVVRSGVTGFTSNLTGQMISDGKISDWKQAGQQGFHDATWGGMTNLAQKGVESTIDYFKTTSTNSDDDFDLWGDETKTKDTKSDLFNNNDDDFDLWGDETKSKITKSDLFNNDDDNFDLWGNNTSNSQTKTSNNYAQNREKPSLEEGLHFPKSNLQKQPNTGFFKTGNISIDDYCNNPNDLTYNRTQKSKDGFCQAIRKNQGIQTIGPKDETVCFTGETLVNTPKGFLPIKKIRLGDSVYSCDESNGVCEIKTVTETFKRKADQIVELKLDNELIKVTPNHPVYVDKKGWVTAGELAIGDLVKSMNGDLLKVNDIRLSSGKFTVYNLGIGDYQSLGVSFENSYVSTNLVKTFNESKEIVEVNPIKNIKIGDIVWDSSNATYKYVVNKHIKKVSDLLLIHAEDEFGGKVSIKITRDHVFYRDNGFKIHGWELTTGIPLTVRGRLLLITEINTLLGSFNTYKIDVSDKPINVVAECSQGEDDCLSFSGNFHNYYVGKCGDGALVHNCHQVRNYANLAFPGIESGLSALEAKTGYDFCNGQKLSNEDRMFKVADSASSALPVIGKFVYQGAKGAYKYANEKSSSSVADKEIKSTSRAARREAMREQNVPTSRPAKSQSGSGNTKQYVNEGSNGENKVVTHHQKDKDHPNNHWHVADPKVDNGEMRKNNYGQIKYKEEGKTTVEYKLDGK